MWEEFGILCRQQTIVLLKILRTTRLYFFPFWQLTVEVFTSLKFSFNKGSEDQPEALAAVRTQRPSVEQKCPHTFQLQYKQNSPSIPFLPSVSPLSILWSIKVSMLLFHVLQLTAVVVSLVAVHDAQDVLQDRWTQVKIQARHGVWAWHSGWGGEGGAGGLAALAHQILVAQASIRVQAEAPVDVQGPAGFIHGVLRGHLREGAGGRDQFADGGGEGDVPAPAAVLKERHARVLLALHAVGLAATPPCSSLVRQRILLRGRGVAQMEAWRFGRSLLVGDEDGHGDGGLQQAGGGVLVVVAVVGAAVRVCFRGEVVVRLHLHALRASVLCPRVGRQHVHLASEETHVPKHVPFPLRTHVCAVTNVPQRGADHVPREDVPKLQLLSFFGSCSF